MSEWIYETAQDNKVRYLLGEKGNNMLLCIGVNPSTATPDKLDPTLRRVRAFSGLIGYRGWVMANLYPYRATNPNELPKAGDENLMVKNELAINRAVYDNNIKSIWVAWGKTIEGRKYLTASLRKNFYDLLCDNNKFVFSLGGLTKDGHPRHPLYLPNTARLQEFDIQKYMAGE